MKLVWPQTPQSSDLKTSHSLSDTDSLFRFCNCLLRNSGVLHSFQVWFSFISLSSALPTGRKYHSHWERNPSLCHGLTRGSVLPKNAQQSYFKDPTRINSVSAFFCKAATWLCSPLVHSDSFGEQKAFCKTFATCYALWITIIILCNVITLLQAAIFFLKWK